MRASSIGVGVGCRSPKLTLIDEASGLAAYITNISFYDNRIALYSSELSYRERLDANEINCSFNKNWTINNHSLTMLS